jgi:predicted porin
MQKKLIVLAVAGILAAPLAAQAGVEIYGQARMSLDFNSDNNPSATAEDSALAVSSNYSSLGFRGDEDLGGGLKALWQFDQGVAFDTSTWNAAKRDSYIGLNGGFGTVLVGNLSTPYRVATSGLDPFRSTRGDNNAIIGSLNGATGWNDENRASNAIAYASPNMSGFSAMAAYIMPSAAGIDDNLPMTTVESEQDAYSLSATFASGPIFVTGGYESWNALGAGGDDVSAFKIGGSYTLMGNTTIGGIWESLDAGGANGDRDAWTLNVKHKMGDMALMAAYAMADEAGGVANTGANQFSLGASYALSKTTEAYALYSMVGNDSAGDYSLDGVNNVLGEDVSSFSVGINHSFSSK